MFGKKANQERLASRISTLLEIMLKDDDSLPNLRCAKSKLRVESLEAAMIDFTKFKRSVAMLQSELSLHAIIFNILTSILYISSPNSDVT